MQSLKEEGKGPGVKVGSSAESTSTGKDKNLLPDIRVQAASLLEMIQDLDPGLSNNERLFLNRASQICTDLIAREERRFETRKTARAEIPLETKAACSGGIS